LKFWWFCCRERKSRCKKVGNQKYGLGRVPGREKLREAVQRRTYARRNIIDEFCAE